MDIHDRLLVETDDACAICGMRGVGLLTEHHIDCDEKNNTYDNLIVLCYNCHQSHHDKKRLSQKLIIDRKRRLIQKTITTYGLSAMKIAAHNDFGVIAMPFLLYHLVGMGLMTKKENQMGYGAQRDATARFAITGPGRV